MKKIILILSLFLSICSFAQVDTLPKYQIMIGNANKDTINQINTIVMVKLVMYGQGVMQKWDYIHTDTITHINYINTPEITRVASLPDLMQLAPPLTELNNNWSLFLQGFKDLPTIQSDLNNFKLSIINMSIDLQIKSILLNLAITNTNATKVITN